MRSRLIAAGLVVFAVLGWVRPAAADGTGDAWNGGDEIGADATDGGSTPDGGGSGGGGSGSAPVCTYDMLTGADADAAESFAGTGWGAPEGDGPGHWYRKICVDDQGNSTATVIWIPDAVPVDPVDLAQDAEDRTPIPEPRVRMNPGAGEEQVVNLATWLWIDRAQWQPVSASASAGGVTVTTTATPTRVEWDMGNGDVVTCAGPGTRYDRSRPAGAQHTDCSYTYRRSSASQPGGAYIVQVTVVWDVTWSVVGAPGGGALGASRRTTTVPIRVAEIQAVNQ